MAERKKEFEQEHAADEGALNGLEGKSGITKGNVQQRAMELKEVILAAQPEGTLGHDQAKTIKKTTFGKRPWTKNTKDQDGIFEDLDVLYDYVQIVADESVAKETHKQALAALHDSVIHKYRKLTESEITKLVIEDKWFASIHIAIDSEVSLVTEQLARRVRELEERYTRQLPELEREVEVFGEKVKGHLRRMGLSL